MDSEKIAVITAVGAWAEALKISRENLEAWNDEATPGIPLLVWCIQNGKISAEEYLIWASQYFNLPVVHQRYFQEAFDAQYLESERQKGNWTEWCFPLEHWDDVVIVACVEPPAEAAPYTCYVLADANALKEVWNLLGHTSAIGEMPEGLTINPTKAFTLNLDATSTNLFNTPPSEPASLPPTPDQHPDESQVGVPPLSLVLNLPTEDSEVPPVPEASVVKPKPEEKKEAPKTAPVAKKAEPVKKSDAAKAKKASRTAESVGDENAMVQAAFAKLRETFDHAFVMRCRDHHAELYAFDPQLEIKGKKAVKVDLAFPTFFRIAFKTAMPYHGYLIDSPAHREFFMAVGLIELPKCVTAVPIKADGTLHGILVAIGNETQQTPESLKLVEEIASSLESTLLAAWSEAA